MNLSGVKCGEEVERSSREAPDTGVIAVIPANARRTGIYGRVARDLSSTIQPQLFTRSTLLETVAPPFVP